MTTTVRRKPSGLCTQARCAQPATHALHYADGIRSTGLCRPHARKILALHSGAALIDWPEPMEFACARCGEPIPVPTPTAAHGLTVSWSGLAPHAQRHTYHAYCWRTGTAPPTGYTGPLTQDVRRFAGTRKAAPVVLKPIGRPPVPFTPLADTVRVEVKP